MLFSNIIGQQVIKERLISTIADNRVSHAQLFLGPEGSGNLAMAIAYAQYLSCTNKGTDDSCGICPSCVKYAKLAHPDLHFIFPINSTTLFSKPLSDNFLGTWREVLLKSPYLNLSNWYDAIGIENKQGYIKAEDCSEILRKLSLKSFESEYKIMVIWMPERLFHAAAPKVLKILEEPPEKTLFLLVAENQEEILKTILSRTQIVKIGRIAITDLQKALVERHGLSEKDAIHIARYSNGNYAESLRLLESSESHEFNSGEFQNWMRLCFKRDWLIVMDWIESIAKIGRERQKIFLKYCLDMVRESLVINYGIKSLVGIDGKELAFAINFSPYINGTNCAHLANTLNKAYFNIERNANPKILFLDMSIKIAGLIKRETIK